MATKKQLKSKARGAYALALARISLGLIFLWAFFDKLLGLGFTTCRDVKTDMVDTMCSQAWVNGGSPTDGFLNFATKGPLADFYQTFAGNSLFAWFFMLGLLFVGVGLVTGIFMKLATLFGSLMLLMMWSAVLPPEHHPLIDDHLVYILLLIAIYYGSGVDKLSMHQWWANLAFVKRFGLLR